MAHEFSFKVGTFPAGTCFSDPQTYANLLADIITVNFAEPLAFFNYGSTSPSPDYQDRPWIRTDANGFYLGTYVYANGSWFSKHPINPGILAAFVDVSANIPTLDGGSSANPFWAPCDGGIYTGLGNINGNSWTYTSPDLRGRTIIGVGSGPGLTARSLNDTGGEEKHQLSLVELPTGQTATFGPNGSSLGTSAYDGGSTATQYGVSFSINPFITGGGNIPHNNMQPWTALNWIVRTPRVF